ncbi:MAG: hypothetical protein FWG72_10770 [Oscillospiraceae bacterium]|nr:hypothetical protein [Oscillospiraceae bacterium]
MKRLKLGEVLSRPYDMKCYRVMTAAGRESSGNRALEMALAGVCDLCEREEGEILSLPSEELTALFDKVSQWYREAAQAVSGQGSGTKLLQGDAITMMYADLFRHKGILPDAIDRQDPAWFFAVVTEQHISEADIPEEMRGFYGL